MVNCTNRIWRIINFCCGMVNGKKLFGESNALHAMMFLERNSFLLFMVSITLYCGIFLKISFSPNVHG